MEDDKKDVTVGGDNPTTGTQTNTNNNDKQDGNKTLSFDELINTNKEYQSAYDKKVREAIETAKANWQEVMDNEKSEAEKLAKMNKEQKLEYQAQKAEHEKANALAKLNAYELKEQALKIASEKGLDVSLLNFFDFSTVKAEELNPKLDEIANTFNKAVEKAVYERLKEDTPISKTGIENIKNKEIPRASY